MVLSFESAIRISIYPVMEKAKGPCHYVESTSSWRKQHDEKLHAERKMSAV